jgi:TatD DNase family protein
MDCPDTLSDSSVQETADNPATPATIESLSTMSHYYDAHLHLQNIDPETLRYGFADFRAAGIRRMVVNGTHERDWEAVALLGEDALVRPSFGLHPWYVKDRSGFWYEQLVNKLDTTPGAFIGEIGLDKWVKEPGLEEQITIFEKQLDLAIARNIPVSIHCLKAWGTLLDILKDRSPIKSGFLLHSYSGPAEMVDAFAKLGAYFSLSGYFARPDKVKKLDPWRVIPMDRLLIETDAPDMLPPTELRTKAAFDRDGNSINHPLNLIGIYDWAADFRGYDIDSFKPQIEQNFLILFGK